MTAKTFTGKSIKISTELEPVSGEVLSMKPPISHAMRFEMTIEPSQGMHALDRAFERARAEGRLPPPPTVDLTCSHCDGTEDFRRHATVKDAMIQVDTFLSAHAECSRKDENDENKHGERRGPL